MQYIKIGKRVIGGKDKEPIVVSEIGINHNGSLDLAIKIADSAIDAGAEIIKHQTHVVEDEMANIAKKVIPGNANESIYDIIKKCSLSEGQEKINATYYVVKGKFFLALLFLGWQLRDWRGLMFHFTKSDRVNAIIIHLLNIFVKKKETHNFKHRYEQY